MINQNKSENSPRRARTIQQDLASSSACFAAATRAASARSLARRAAACAASAFLFALLRCRASHHTPTLERYPETTHRPGRSRCLDAPFPWLPLAAPWPPSFPGFAAVAAVRIHQWNAVSAASVPCSPPRAAVTVPA